MMPERRIRFPSFQLVNGFTRMSAGNIFFEYKSNLNDPENKYDIFNLP
jgi:hypothetical protein